GCAVGDEEGASATFVQENGVLNDLPGSAFIHELNQQADNDYSFSGVYTHPIASVITEYGDYMPVGLVPRNEEAAERAFAGADSEQRYHFNLPDTLKPTNVLSVTFDALSLEDPSDVITDPRYGVEVYVNGVLVQSQVLIRTNQLGVAYTTPQFTLASVNAQVGLGPDNIVTLRGIDRKSTRLN